MANLHDSQQEELLSKLAEFYKKRYQDQAEFEKKFNDAAEDLIETGDVERTVFLVFCTENDIEPRTKKKKVTPPTPPTPKKSSTSSRSSSGSYQGTYDKDPCGRGYSRSSC